MSNQEVVKNRYEFLYFFDCQNGNPNGDPEMDNSPRLDPETQQALVSDVALKRRIRNFVGLKCQNEAPNAIFIQHAINLNRTIALSHEQTGGFSTEKKAPKDKVHKATEWMCKNFYDIRTFGAVMSTGANAGQVRGPIQLTFARSLDRVLSMNLCITRVATAKKEAKVKTSQDYLEWEKKQPEDELRGMGRKTMIPYGLFVAKGFVSAHLAAKTGFTEADLDLFWEALLGMWDHDRSSSKGMMSCRGLYIFKHSGWDKNKEFRTRQAVLGCSPAQDQLDLGKIVTVTKKVEGPLRNFEDYEIAVETSRVSKGVELEQEGQLRKRLGLM